MNNRPKTDATETNELRKDVIPSSEDQQENSVEVNATLFVPPHINNFNLGEVDDDATTTLAPTVPVTPLAATVPSSPAHAFIPNSGPTIPSPSIITEDKSGPEIPRKMHFIWLGGPIPAKYLAQIEQLSKIAEKSHFEINLWVDDRANYIKTLSKMQKHIDIPNVLEIKDLHIRNIDELKANMATDPFYQENNKLRKYWDCVDRERVGFKNLAAASDLLRYEILREEGGWYVDTDTDFHLTADSVLTTASPTFGIKGNLGVDYMAHIIQGKNGPEPTYDTVDSTGMIISRMNND